MAGGVFQDAVESCSSSEFYRKRVLREPSCGFSLCYFIKLILLVSVISTAITTLWLNPLLANINHDTFFNGITAVFPDELRIRVRKSAQDGYSRLSINQEVPYGIELPAFLHGLYPPLQFSDLPADLPVALEPDLPAAAHQHQQQQQGQQGHAIEPFYPHLLAFIPPLSDAEISDPELLCDDYIAWVLASDRGVVVCPINWLAPPVSDDVDPTMEDEYERTADDAHRQQQPGGAAGDWRHGAPAAAAGNAHARQQQAQAGQHHHPQQLHQPRQHQHHHDHAHEHQQQHADAADGLDGEQHAAAGGGVGGGALFGADHHHHQQQQQGGAGDGFGAFDGSEEATSEVASAFYVPLAWCPPFELDKPRFRALVATMLNTFPLSVLLKFKLVVLIADLLLLIALTAYYSMTWSWLIFVGFVGSFVLLRVLHLLGFLSRRYGPLQAFAVAVHTATPYMLWNSLIGEANRWGLYLSAFLWGNAVLRWLK